MKSQIAEKFEFNYKELNDALYNYEIEQAEYWKSIKYYYLP